MCLDCGFYNGKMVVDMKAKKEAREVRLETKRETIRSQAGLPEASPAEIPGAEEKKEHN
jgi:hypothetical protein